MLPANHRLLLDCSHCCFELMPLLPRLLLLLLLRDMAAVCCCLGITLVEVAH
jgi:hypothetical protein